MFIRKVLIEPWLWIGGESQRKQVSGGTDVEEDFNARLSEWS